jgi:hypothetical protein
MTSILPLDHIAAIGYSVIFLFGAYKLSDTIKRPVDLVANVILLVGLGALITYHFKKITSDKDETNDLSQKQVRQLAHASIVTFFVITLTPASKANFRLYDTFGLAAHTILLYTVTTAKSQLVGVGLLAVYFAFATYQKIDLRGAELLQLIGRALLLIFFTVTFIEGIFKI